MGYYDRDGRWKSGKGGGKGYSNWYKDPLELMVDRKKKEKEQAKYLKFFGKEKGGGTISGAMRTRRGYAPGASRERGER